MENRRVLTMVRGVLGFLVLSGVFCMGAGEAQALGANYRGPFEGRVVDASTLRPIEGAVVLVTWVIRHAFAHSDFYDATEVLTDANGAFSIPKKWSWNPWWNLVMDSQVHIFKAGYGNVTTHWTTLKDTAEFLRKLAPEERERVGPAVYFDIQFDEERPTFLLKPLTTRQDRIRNLEDLDTIMMPDEKRWRLLKEIQKEDETILRGKRPPEQSFEGGR